MLFLTSNGLTSPMLIKEIKKTLDHALSGHRAALVVTADPDYKEQNWHVKPCQQILQDLGLTVDLFDLDQTDVKNLLNYDVVECIGGNPYYFLHRLNQSMAKPIFQQLAQAPDKLIMAWSASALAFGPSLRLIDRLTPEMNKWLTDLTGLHLFDDDLLPHFDKCQKRFKNLDTILKQFESDLHTKVRPLQDGEGYWPNLR
ncbi:Type 1 glutamine amidotransferase-like domain-containing protein [Streptococcus merionis]|uniref:Type 1 glutamine amidotransferase-like domain-containing protein n=1 Tax=Streptococcus merionis TaxID=400065 RepID=UPI0026EB148F|nr:Type 1 glutamine amidotransferase-like domain-containing protein [Streptococcus merionis]